MKIEWLKLSEKQTFVFAHTNRQNAATNGQSRKHLGRRKCRYPIEEVEVQMREHSRRCLTLIILSCVLLLVGCATTVSIADAKKTLDGKAPCCNTFSELRYKQLPDSGPALESINGRSQVFFFDTGKTFVAAFELLPHSKAVSLRLRSYALGADIYKSQIFCPQVIVLDERYVALEQPILDLFIELGTIKETIVENSWGLRLRFENEIVLNPAARYVLVNTSSELLDRSFAYTVPRFVPMGSIPRTVNIQCSPFGQLSLSIENDLSEQDIRTPVLKIANIDERTGLLQSGVPISKATVIVSKKLPLSQFKGMAYVTTDDSNYEGLFVGQIRAIHYFKEVIDHSGLAALIDKNDLHKDVLYSDEPISLNRLYHAYEPFLWLQFKSGGNAAHPTIQLIVINPENLDEVFVSQADISFWNGLTNENGFYPIINSLIEWINMNK